MAYPRPATDAEKWTAAKFMLRHWLFCRPRRWRFENNGKRRVCERCGLMHERLTP